MQQPSSKIPPKPPYKSIASQEESDYDLVPVLRRDNDESIQKTLARLKGNQTISTNPTYKDTYSIISTPKILHKIAANKWVVTSIIFLIAAGSFSLFFNDGSLNEFSFISQSNNSYIIIDDNDYVKGNIIDILNKPPVEIDFKLNRELSQINQTEFNRKALSELGLGSDQRLTHNLRSNIYMERQNNDKYIVGFAIYDAPLAKSILRSWEKNNSSFILSNGTSPKWVDIEKGDLNFRTSEGIAYTIIDENVVLIGDSVDTVIDNRLRSISKLSPN